MSKSFQPTDYAAYDFATRRHIGPSPEEIDQMLSAMGYQSLDELIDATVPPAIRQKQPLDWGPAMTERDALFYMRSVAKKNTLHTSLIGQGYYGTTTPCTDSSQYSGKSSLVHRLYAVSAGNCSGQTGGVN